MSLWLLLFGIPTLLQGYIVGLLSFIFGLTHNFGFDGPVLVSDWRPWWDKRWRWTTTIGGWMGRSSRFNRLTRFHENTHLRQYVDLNVLAVVLSLSLLPWLGWQVSLILWGTSGAPWLLPNFLTAMIRHKRPGVSWMDAVYRSASHEEHAYAVTAQERQYK